MYQVYLRRKNGITLEKVGAPVPDHDQAVATVTALLDERFCGEWKPANGKPDLWVARGTQAAKILETPKRHGQKIIVQVGLSPDQYEALRERAQRDRRTPSSLAAILLEDALK